VFTTRPELLGTMGMVASTHWLASAAGMAVLEEGGNAADAAVAAGFVLQVVEPHLNGLGGEVMILAHPGGDAEAVAICGQGPAPMAATIARYRELGLDAIPDSGLLAACVPGAFDAWMLLLRDQGSLHLRDVLSYAVDYAGAGYPVVPAISVAVASVRRLFAEEWLESARTWLPGGEPPAPGSVLRNSDLARTYQRLLAAAEAAGSDRVAQIDAARDAFACGFVAETIDRWLSEAEVLDATGRRNRGLLRGDDLARWRATVETPIGVPYAGLQVLKCTVGQGPVLLQLLRLLEGFDLVEMGHNSAAYVHTVTESAKLAFADREAFYGDPSTVEVPLDGLLDPAYAESRRSLVGERASLELRPGRPDGREPRLPRFGGAAPVTVAPPSFPTLHVPEPGDTCHVDVVDRGGAMVSATPSGGWLQSSPVIPGLGFPLGTRAQMLWLDEGHPNALLPGKRPRTTLTPTLALRGGRPALAMGTPGGDTQEQWTLNVLLGHVHFGLDLQAAIDAANFHSSHFPSSFHPHDAFPGRLHVEGRFDGATIAELRRRGHDVVVEERWSLGRVSAVARDENGLLRAAANPRGMQGYAVGR